jgi:hypothetical protein
MWYSRYHLLATHAIYLKKCTGVKRSSATEPLQPLVAGSEAWITNFSYASMVQSSAGTNCFFRSMALYWLVSNFEFTGTGVNSTQHIF